MYRKSVSDEDLPGRNFMAVILQTLPQEAELTKVEYEGPRIALYSRNPAYLLRESQLISNMVNTIKKRIVIRSDESIRKSEEDCRATVASDIPREIEYVDSVFDEALGEATVFVKRPWKLAQFSSEAESVDLTEKTGWRVRMRKAPCALATIKEIYSVLGQTAAERTRFLRETGDKIFRAPLAESAEATLIALGGYAEVGRSCTLLLTGDSKVIIDCGLSLFSRDSLMSLPRFDISGISIDEIDGVVITHAHIDHSGCVPFLFKYGYKGPVYCTEPTLPLMYLLQKSYVDYAADKAVYSTREIEDMVSRTITLTYGSVTDISPDMKIVLSNSGHIPGSSSVHVHVGNGDHNIVFTGDMKFGRTLSVENAVWSFPRVETLVIESTYGGREEPVVPREQAEAEFASVINTTIEQGGNALIPVPLVGTGQEIVLLLDSLIQSGRVSPLAPIILDHSLRLSASIYEAYPEYLDKELRGRILRSESSQFGFSENFVVSDSIAKLDKPSVIIAPSGTLSWGSSVEYLKMICQSVTNRLVFVSYQPQGTPGRVILQGGRKITLAGSSLDIKCQVSRVAGLDLHSDRNQLMAYVGRLKPKLRRVLVNHGDRLYAQNLASSISKMLRVPAQHPLVEEAVKLL